MPVFGANSRGIVSSIHKRQKWWDLPKMSEESWKLYIVQRQLWQWRGSGLFLLLKYILVIDWEISRQTEKVKSKSFGTISWRSTPNHEILSTITTKATDLQDMIDILPKNLGNITKQKAQWTFLFQKILLLYSSHNIHILFIECWWEKNFFSRME